MKSNREWWRWGDSDPLFGVASWSGRKKGGPRPWTDKEFYSLGEDWFDFLEQWNRYGVNRGILVEIGCGAGRITNQAANDFSQVIAVDVSQGMLDYAKARVPQSNIEWKLSEGATIPCPGNSVDAAFSCHVLQHFPSKQEQLACFREIHRVLRPGGTFMIHLPLHSFPSINRNFSRLARFAYRCYLTLTDMKAVILRAMVQLGIADYMHGISHDMDELHRSLSDIGFSRVEFSTFPVRTNGTLHTCAIGTKSTRNSQD